MGTFKVIFKNSTNESEPFYPWEAPVIEDNIIQIIPPMSQTEILTLFNEIKQKEYSELEITINQKTTRYLKISLKGDYIPSVKAMRFSYEEEKEL